MAIEQLISEPQRPVMSKVSEAVCNCSGCPFAARYDWAEILDEYSIDTLLLERRKMGPLVDAAEADPGWTRCYDDEYVTIFMRGYGT